MYRKLSTGAIAAIMFQAVIGCRHGNIVSLVTPPPALNVQHLAKAGQTLEWRTINPSQAEFWVQFDYSPCKKGDKVLHGTNTAPAQCEVGKQQNGKGYIQYNYTILPYDPTNRPHPLSVTPCKGCIYDTGSLSPQSGSTDVNATATSMHPKAATASDDDHEVLIDCNNSKTIIAPAITTTGSVFWGQTPNAIGWKVHFLAPQPNQPPLCSGGTSSGGPDFDSTNFTCTFNANATGTYSYSVTINGCVMPASPPPGFSVTVGTAAIQEP
jgi:hypothetical protein